MRLLLACALLACSCGKSSSSAPEPVEHALEERPGSLVQVVVEKGDDAAPAWAAYRVTLVGPFALVERAIPYGASFGEVPVVATHGVGRTMSGVVPRPPDEAAPLRYGYLDAQGVFDCAWRPAGPRRREGTCRARVDTLSRPSAFL